MCRNVKCIYRRKKGHSDFGVEPCSSCLGPGLFPRELYFIYVYGSSWAENRKVLWPGRVISEVRCFRFYFIFLLSMSRLFFTPHTEVRARRGVKITSEIILNKKLFRFQIVSFVDPYTLYGPLDIERIGI